MLVPVTAVLITKKRIVLLPLSPPAVVLQPGLTSSSFSSRCRCQSPPRWGSGREKNRPFSRIRASVGSGRPRLRYFLPETALRLTGTCALKLAPRRAALKISFHFLSHCSSRRGVPRSETSRGRSETNCCGACLLFQKNPR